MISIAYRLFIVIYCHDQPIINPIHIGKYTDPFCLILAETNCSDPWQHFKECHNYMRTQESTENWCNGYETNLVKIKKLSSGCVITKCINVMTCSLSSICV
jgi:hypothetical protein